MVYALIFNILLINGSGDNMSSSRSQNEGPVPIKEFKRRQVKILGMFLNCQLRIRTKCARQQI